MLRFRNIMARGQGLLAASATSTWAPPIPLVRAAPAAAAGSQRAPGPPDTSGSARYLCDDQGRIASASGPRSGLVLHSRAGCRLDAARQAADAAEFPQLAPRFATLCCSQGREMGYPSAHLTATRKGSTTCVLPTNSQTEPISTQARRYSFLEARTILQRSTASVLRCHIPAPGACRLEDTGVPDASAGFFSRIGQLADERLRTLRTSTPGNWEPWLSGVLSRMWWELGVA
jgi:hypothetical protein